MVTGYQRVITAINGGRPNRIPRGELIIAEQLYNGLSRSEGKLNLNQPETFLREIWLRKYAFLQELGHDLVVVVARPPEPVATGYVTSNEEEVFIDEWNRSFINCEQCRLYTEPSQDPVRAMRCWELPKLQDFNFKETVFWAQETDLFVFGMVTGGFTEAANILGFGELLRVADNKSQVIKDIINEVMDFQTQIVLQHINAGAHGIILADDLAYDHGPFLNPLILREVLFPSYRLFINRLQQHKVPVFFHCDGNLETLMEDIITLGFDGLQCIEWAQGDKLKHLKENYGSQLCFMGNLPLEKLIGETKEEDIENLRSFLDQLHAGIYPGNGFIFSTTSGLTKDINKDILKFCYHYLDEIMESKKQLTLY